jgi:hypothetical protein
VEGSLDSNELTYRNGEVARDSTEPGKKYTGVMDRSEAKVYQPCLISRTDLDVLSSLYGKTHRLAGSGFAIRPFAIM